MNLTILCNGIVAFLVFINCSVACSTFDSTGSLTASPEKPLIGLTLRRDLSVQIQNYNSITTRTGAMLVKIAPSKTENYLKPTFRTGALIKS
jgi:hypothetical protein